MCVQERSWRGGKKKKEERVRKCVALRTRVRPFNCCASERIADERAGVLPGAVTARSSSARLSVAARRALSAPGRLGEEVRRQQPAGITSEHPSLRAAAAA